MEAEGRRLDVLTIGEMVVDFISTEKTDTLSNASTFRRYLGGSPANVAVHVSKLGGTPAVISKTGIGAFGMFLEGELQRHGVTTDFLLMAHLDGKDWPETVRFAHEVASLKLKVDGHVERMIDREHIYAGPQHAGQRAR